MKVLKIIGIIVLVVILLGVGVIIFGPSEVHMERQISIDAPVEAVFSEVNGFKAYDQFSAWSEIDTTAKVIIEGPPSGVGASYSWESDSDLGIGKIEIIESDQNMMVKSKMNFEGYPGEPIATWILTEEDGKTNVTYTYDETDISGIWKLFALGTESMLSPMYERTLAKLKERIESRPDFNANISVEEVLPVTFLGMEVTIVNDPDEIDKVMGETYGAIMSTIIQNGLNITEGYPLAVCTAYDEDSMTLICGIPVADGTTLDSGSMRVMQSPDGDAVRALHFGNYELLEGTHEQINQYVDYYGYEVTGPPWEVYVTGSSSEPDTAKWVTEVYYPVK